jgi:hypothetical protein
MKTILICTAINLAILLIVLIVLQRWYFIQLDIIQQFFNRQNDKFIEILKKYEEVIDQHLTHPHNPSVKNKLPFPELEGIFFPDAGKTIRESRLSSILNIFRVVFRGK